MTIHIFRYSQLIDTDRMRTIKAFAEKSGLPEEVIGKIAITEEKKGGLILQYKSGDISTIEFRTKLQEVIKNNGGIQLADNVFDDCWNAMCIVNPIKFKELHQFQLEHKNCKIHIIGDTNELQHKYIGEQIALLPEKPKIAYTLSFEEHTSDRNDLAELVEKAYSDEEIVPQYIQTEDSLELLVRYYQYASSSEGSSLEQQDITGKVVEDSTNESSKSLVEDTIDVMGGLELSSNPGSVE